MSTAELIAPLHADMTSWRRDMHAHPELGFAESRTAELVANKLGSFGLEVHRGVGRTGVVATLRAGSGRRSLGLRADMDALPITEANTFAHRSRHDGVMHACGRGTARGAGAATALAVLLLAGCASTPQRVGEPPATAAFGRPGAALGGERDGPETQPPAGLAQAPDAEPRIEAIRNGGPNKPYEALGREYVPITDDRPFVERGLASWYGRKFQGRRTSSGEPYDMYAMTAAHPTLPIPSYARVRNPANGREVVVRINDRGPFHPGRIVDLSYTAALKLDVLRGVAAVEVERITADEIRSGTWRRAESDTLLAVEPPRVERR